MPTFARSVALGVAAAGHPVSAVAVKQRPGTSGEVPPPNLPVRELPRGPFATGAAFGRVLKEEGPDLIHFIGGPRNPVHLPWSRPLWRSGIPYVVSGNGNLSDLSFRHRWGGRPEGGFHVLKKRAFHHLFDRPLLRRAAAVHATARNEAAVAMTAGATRTFIVPFSTYGELEPSSEPFKPRDFARPATFTYLGRFSSLHKGLDLIIDGFGEAATRGLGSRFRLIFAGTDEKGSLERLQSRAKEVGLENIEFRGATWGDDKRMLWSETDYFLHMGRYTGFALAPREALLEGIPLITTRESDYGDWVADYDMGAVVQLDATALADTVGQLLDTSEATYNRWSGRAKDYVRDTRWDITGKRFAAEYERILAGDFSQSAGAEEGYV